MATSWATKGHITFWCERENQDNKLQRIFKEWLNVCFWSAEKVALPKSKRLVCPLS
jgi:hypothetical protein